MRILKRTTSLLASLATLALALPVTEARADILPLSVIITQNSDAKDSPCQQQPHPCTGGYIWSYRFLITPGTWMIPGDSFTIYDFGPGQFLDYGYSTFYFFPSTDPFAPTPVNSSSGVLTPTQTAALNWTFTWEFVDPRSADFSISLWSPSGTPQVAAFVGNTVNSTPVECHGPDWPDCTWLRDANLTTTLVPTTTPEPTTVVLLGSGMLGIAGVTWRRRKRSA